jgi:hypothetical protein
VDKEARPGVAYTYSVVPVFHGTIEKFRDLVASFPSAILENARYLQSQADGYWQTLHTRFWSAVRRARPLPSLRSRSK